MTGDGPTWLCVFRGQPSTYASGNTAEAAAAECQNAGLGRPEAVHYAGYVAEPPTEAPRARERIPMSLEPKKRSTRRVEHVLMLYGLLRVDFPIGSILKPAEASARLPSPSALRDFLANVGLAIERLSVDPRIVDRVIENQGKAWIESARETNSRRIGRSKDADTHAERKIRYRQHAQRLRKRVGYRKAIAELAAAVDGALPRSEAAEDNFRDALGSSGLSVDDIHSLISRYRRITSPKM